MKITLCLAGLLLILGGLGIAQQQQQQQKDACGFLVKGEPIQPTVAGPDDIVPLVYVVEQPDSPIEITSVDLRGTSISASDKEIATVYTLESCVTYKVHNRSDRRVQKFDLELVVSPGGFQVGNFEGGGPSRVRSSSPLASGQSVEIKACSGLLSGTMQRNSPASDKSVNQLRLLVSVDAVDLGDCFYRASLRIPRSAGVVAWW
jgi:hypothetical protein